MKKFESAKKRFIYFLDKQDITRNKFYQISGMSNGSLDTESGLSESSILKIIEIFPEISLDWLLLEKGEMLRKNTPKNSNIAIASAPQATANNGDMRVEAPAQLLDIIAKQQDTIAAQAAIIQSLLTMPGNDQKNTSK